MKQQRIDEIVFFNSRITQTLGGEYEGKEVGRVTAGAYFGDVALLTNQTRLCFKGPAHINQLCFYSNTLLRPLSSSAQLRRWSVAAQPRSKGPSLGLVPLVPAPVPAPDRRCSPD